MEGLSNFEESVRARLDDQQHLQADTGDPGRGLSNAHYPSLTTSSTTSNLPLLTT